MQIHLKAIELELTPSLKAYAEEKLAPLSKLITKAEEMSEAELVVELARTTRHHHRGPVLRAEANLRLPGKLLRAEHTDSDMHVAIDRVRDKLKMEILKYKTLKSIRGVFRWGKGK